MVGIRGLKSFPLPSFPPPSLPCPPCPFALDAILCHVRLLDTWDHLLLQFHRR